MDKMPAYAKVYNAIKKEIADGEYAAGELIPTEPELEKKFNVSRTTVRKAIELLSQEGFVQAKQGRGTIVLDCKTKQNISTGAVSTLFDTLTKSGHKVYPKITYVDIIEAHANLAKELEISENDKVARVQRIQTADGKPFAILKDYIPYYLASGIEKTTDPIISLFDFLEVNYHIMVDSTHVRISAKNADFTEAEMLQIPIGTALVYFKRVCYDASGRAVCSNISSTVGDKYEVEIMENRGKSNQGY